MDAAYTEPSQVWLVLLEHWAEEARIRGAKSATAYLKAHRALSECTDTFTHPCETVRVKGIGDSIAHRLEVEYEQWCREHNLEPPERHDTPLPAPERTRKQRKVKDYIPAFRSGAHGILVGLYTKVMDEQDEEAQVGKAELIARAQPYCDKDYNVPSGGGSHAGPRSLRLHGAPSASQSAGPSRRNFITAWAGMKTLIDKGYVYRQGNPPLFSLSPDGWQVARALASAEGLTEPTGRDAVPQPIPAPSAPPTRPAPPMATQAETLPPSSPPAERLPQLYLPPRTQNKAIDLEPVVIIDDEVDEQEGADPNMHLLINLVPSSSDDVYEVGPPEPQPAPIGTPCQRPKSISISLIDSSPIVISSSSKAQESTTPICQPFSQSSPLSEPDAPPMPPCYTFPPSSYTIHMVMDFREVRVRSLSMAGGGPSRRVTFEEALEHRGITCDLRVLELGDIIWVARPKPNLEPSLARMWSYTQEVVLDTIIERKRLDDLANSLVDGRWHNQKKRLRESGMGQVIFLIEDIDVTELMYRYGKQIQTALSSTQVIDGFFVQRTADGQATVDFLVTVHQTLEDMYRDQPLYVLKEHTIDRDHYHELQQRLRADHPDKLFHVPFQTYQQLNGKTSSSGMLQDTWARMLLCIRGASEDKVLEVVHRWPTPQHLVQAYKACASEEEARRLLSRTIDPQTPVARRQIGPKLSERIWQVMRA
ncbi:Crossover junction endonuclease mus81 [Malassezia equina]|uniref:Crossover junction endonuclease MUS81 n=1 Tax=Malassezia equina TaxID=1381935 RepID=A0AAF0EK22_9BASI|nr:Crossover junction endonuclease mus81 [Malassezia equina]